MSIVNLQLKSKNLSLKERSKKRVPNKRKTKIKEKIMEK
jgi:hypothetical protein